MDLDESEPAGQRLRESTPHHDDDSMDGSNPDNNFEQAYEDDLDGLPPPSDDIEESPTMKRLAIRNTPRCDPQPAVAPTIQVHKPVFENNAFAQFNFLPAQHGSRNLQEDKSSSLGFIQGQGTEDNNKPGGHESPQSVLARSLRTSDLSSNLPSGAGLLDMPRQNLRGADGTTKRTGKQDLSEPVPCAPDHTAGPHGLPGHCLQQEIRSSSTQELATSHVDTSNGHAKSAADRNETPYLVEAMMNSSHIREATSDPVQFETPEPMKPCPPVLDITTPGAGRHRPTSPSMNHSIGAGLSLIHSSRVSKAPRRIRARMPHAERPPTPVTADPQQPSDEDLFYILMSRTRETRHALKRLECLEEENVRLRQENAASDEERQRMLLRQEQIELERNTLIKSLEAFKEKYYKLKNWALEANQDCEGLANVAFDLKQSLAEVSRERDDLFRQLRDLQYASGSATDKMDALRSRIRDATNATQVQGAALDNLSGQLLQQEQRLKDERYRSRRLETHILYMEQERDKQSLSIISKADMLDASLQIMSGKLQALMDTRGERVSENIEAFKTFMEMCQLIREKDLVTNADLEGVTHTLESLRDMMEGHSRSINETFVVSMGDFVEKLQRQSPTETDEVQSQEESSATETSLGNSSVQQGQVINLLRDGTSMSKSDPAKPLFATEAIREFLEAHKTMSRQRITTLQTELNDLSAKYEEARGEVDDLSTQHKTAEGQINELRTKHEDAQKKADDLLAEYETLQGEKSELQTTYEATHTKLGELSGIHEEAKAEIRTYRHQLVERREELEDLEKDLDYACHDVASLEIALAQALDEIARLGAEQQHQENEKIRTLQDNLDGESHRRRELEEMLRHNQALLAECQHKLKKAQAGSDAAARENKSLQSHVDYLERNVDQAQETARKMTQTSKALETANAELSELQKKQEDFDQLQEKVVSQEVELRQKGLEVQLLRKRAVELQDSTEKLNEEVRRNADVANEKLALEKELAELQGHILDQAELQTTIQDLRNEKEALNGALLTAQNRATEADALKLKNEELDEAIKSMAAELEQSRQECGQLPSLNQALSDRDNSIASLQKQLEAAVTEAEGQTKDKDEELRRKDEQVASLEKEIADLQQELLVCEGELANARLDKNAQRQPQRRVADRSGKTAGVAKGSTCSGSTNNVEGVEFLRDDAGPQVETSTPRSSGNLTVVPETQFEQGQNAHSGPNDLLADEALLNDGSTSELSSVPEDVEGEDGREEGTQSKHQSQGNQQVMNRAPSSSYSSQGEQMLLDQLSENDARFGPGMSTRPSTITSRQESDNEDVVDNLDQTNVITRVRTDWNNGSGRRGLRSESNTQGRHLTCLPEESEPHSYRNRDMTPVPTRERHQPNSAAKRRIEHDDVSKASEEPKKLKRSPTKLEVQGRQNPNAKSQPTGPTPGITSAFRKGGNVNVSTASATAKGQRAGKAGRKSSRQDKYAARFAANP